MKLLVIYDISRNDMRIKVMNHLFSKGFKRINLSGYLGDFNRNDFDPLLYSLKPYVSDEDDSIYAVPIEESEIKRVRIIESSRIRSFTEEDTAVI